MYMISLNTIISSRRHDIKGMWHCHAKTIGVNTWYGTYASMPISQCQPATANDKYYKYHLVDTFLQTILDIFVRHRLQEINVQFSNAKMPATRKKSDPVKIFEKAALLDGRA